MWRYLRNPTFSRFDTIPDCDRQTHDDGMRHVVKMAGAQERASTGSKERSSKNDGAESEKLHSFTYFKLLANVIFSFIQFRTVYIVWH